MSSSSEKGGGFEDPWEDQTFCSMDMATYTEFISLQTWRTWMRLREITGSKLEQNNIKQRYNALVVHTWE